MKLTQNTKLVMIGDSITDAGRAHPVGEGPGAALGNGYVSLVDSLLGAARPELGVRVVNVGTSGHTVRDLAARWQRDVLALKPDWLSVMIGTNDVWRQFDNPNRPEMHVLLDEFERTLDALVARTLPTLSGLVLMTPFYVEPNNQTPCVPRWIATGPPSRTSPPGTILSSWTPRPPSTPSWPTPPRRRSRPTKSTPARPATWSSPAPFCRLLSLSGETQNRPPSVLRAGDLFVL